MPEFLNYMPRGGAKGQRWWIMAMSAVTSAAVAAVLYVSRTPSASSPPVITYEVFTCPATQPTIFPSSGADRWDFGGGDSTALSWSNWNDQQRTRASLSYNYADPFPKATRP